MVVLSLSMLDVYQEGAPAHSEAGGYAKRNLGSRSMKREEG